MLFISHSSKDAEAAHKVVELLEQNGLTCWIAPRDIIPGKSYPAQIINAIRECNGFILVASENVNQSNHINSELARAFDLKKTIFPFLIDGVHFSDDFIYYLGQIQWINAYDNFDKGLEALFAVIQGQPASSSSLAPSSSRSPIEAKAPMQERKTASQSKKEDVYIATYQELVAAGMTAIEIAKRLVENDYKLYPGMVTENEGEPEQWAQYLSTYPETFRYLVNAENEIIGNWSFLAVSEELHAEKLANGELTEETFTLDETEFLLFPGDYVGYLLNLSVNEGYNITKNINMLLTAFVDQLLAFADDGIFFKSWYVNVFRKDHEAMYRRMGFQYFLDNKSFGKLYHLDCAPFPSRSIFAMNKRLMEVYCEHYL